MNDKRQILPDNPTVADLHAVIGELQDQLAMMHEECDEHEENDGDIIMELRAEIERLRAALAEIGSVLHTGVPVDHVDADAAWKRLRAAVARATK